MTQSGTATNPYKFAGSWGYRDDGDAGLLQVGLRYYDPEVGRFTTADLWLGDILLPQSLNRYVYVINNPINLADVASIPVWVGVVLVTGGAIGLAYLLGGPTGAVSTAIGILVGVIILVWLPVWTAITVGVIVAGVIEVIFIVTV